jgi:Fe-S cluster biogenesis protein NfuA
MINNLLKRAQRPRDDVSAKDVSKVLRMIRPSYRQSGGNVELVDVEGRSVTVRLVGAHEGGPIDFDQNAGAIDRIIRSRVPQVQQLTIV